MIKIHKNIKIWIIALVALLLITFYLIIIMYTRKSEEKATQNPTNKIQYIGDSFPIQDILVLEENAIIKTEAGLHRLSYRNKNIGNISQPKGDFILSQENSEVYFCHWENFIIYEPTEIATRAQVYSEKMELIFKEELSETLMPTYCNGKKIEYTDAFPFQSDHNPKKPTNMLTIQGVSDTTLLLESEVIVKNLAIENIFTSGYLSNDHKTAILQDSSGGIWLVEIPP